MFKHLIIVAFAILIPFYGLAADPPQTTAVRTTIAPSIDGSIDEDCWKLAPVISHFTQYVPAYNQKGRFNTEVRLLYDNSALYVSAMMFDDNPDSILCQLGNRDNQRLNADMFIIALDTYNNNLDSYVFGVYASGVQFDERESDGTYDAVWKSAVSIHSKGWSVEIRIPFSAIRFPEIEEQLWGMQIKRNIRRNRETDQWALEVKGASNQQLYWGKLMGIKQVEPPLRLSLSPYFGIALEHYPFNVTNQSNFSYSFSGGMDLKYGINESFTLDVTLLPDFTQVKSDDKIKNLSAFETIYSEKRPFFNEAVELFEKGNLFYSRRIGRTPSKFYDVSSQVDSGDVIISNPAQAKLLNAFKFSGRNRKGLAIGVLNAITAEANAEIQQINGSSNKFMTEPLTNYNILVFDKALKNNSSIYLINTSVIREGHHRKANVTGAGFKLMSPSNVYRLSSSGALSQIYMPDTINSYDSDYGYKFSVSAGKVDGVFQYSAFSNVMDNHFNANDLGVTRHKNYINNGIELQYNIFEPFWQLRDFEANFNVNHRINYSTHKTEEFEIELEGEATSIGYTTYWYGLRIAPLSGYDYYEPRVAGRYYRLPAWTGANVGFSTDYRKPFAFDLYLNGGLGFEESVFYNLKLGPLVRFSDKLSMRYTLIYERILSDKGFVEFDNNEQIVFATRDITGLENRIEMAYNFRNNLSLNLWFRYYWYTGDYNKFYLLSNEGRLIQETQSAETGFNFNTYNLDLSFNWEFAPGSNLSIVWKNSVLTEEENPSTKFFTNVSNTFGQSQLNNFSLRLLYYIDYQSIFN
ncbi:MAG: DUF5916 domain-containing protein [Bacteroidales bacterium]|nr:DUF5916 domain-containing protein [Bacteroidales bacterium]